MAALDRKVLDEIEGRLRAFVAEVYELEKKHAVVIQGGWADGDGVGVVDAKRKEIGMQFR